MNPPSRPGPPAKPPGLSQGQKSIFDLMAQTLASWGLATLVPELRKLILGGDTSPDTLSLALSQTKEYKARFAGNAIREANGLADLTPAQYIAMEEGYRQVLQQYGLPKGFYDSQKDFEKLIGGDVSVTELQARAQIAHDQYTSAPQYVKDLWTTYFGSKGDALAAILDPATATQVIQDRATQVSIGGAAAQFGMQLNQPRAQLFQQNGITLADAQKAYQRIAQTRGTDQQIAQRFGTTFDQTQEENDLLLGDASAGDKRQSLYGEEQALFRGHGGTDQNALSVSQEH